MSIHVHSSAIKQQFVLPIQQLQSSRMAFNQFENMAPAKVWMQEKLKELI